MVTQDNGLNVLHRLLDIIKQSQAKDDEAAKRLKESIDRFTQVIQKAESERKKD